MTQQKEYYQILGVSRDATEEEIKKAFRQQALKYHPDRNQEPGADAKFKEINDLFTKYSKGELKGILDVTDENLVSIDFLGNTNSSIIDLNSTLEIGENMFKIVSWYDNEWGYSYRTIDLIKLMLSKMK